jgi:glutamate 5-kinase
VEVVSHLTPALLAAAGGTGSAVGTGGMRTKLEAAQRASAAGVATVLFNGTRADVLQALAHDRLRGTRIHALRTRVAVRKHWLQNAPAEPGGIFIDAGAGNALVEKGASLLPGGVVAAEGEFRRGDMVEVLVREEGGVRRVARGVSQYSAADIRRIARRHSREIESILGYSYGDTVIHRDDLMLV